MILKYLKSLESSHTAKKQNVTLVQGKNAVGSVIQKVTSEYIKGIYCSNKFDIDNPDFFPDQKITILDDFDRLTSDNQGIVAILKREDFSNQVLDFSNKIIPVLHNIRDPFNLGNIIRSADALGYNNVIISGESVDINNPKVIRSSAGSIFNIKLNKIESLVDLNVYNRELVGLDIKGSLSLNSLKIDNPVFLVFGNEAWGLKAEDCDLLNKTIKIEMQGDAESLNLANSVAITLYSLSLK